MLGCVWATRALLTEVRGIAYEGRRQGKSRHGEVTSTKDGDVVRLVGVLAIFLAFCLRSGRTSVDKVSPLPPHALESALQPG